ncbi:hypothetical protein C8Q74DRAFT_1363979 [Fomes fomentarius]|nr:hypothetical protein C8Q74DRAFT_1363979 [Fomes fomentarius]
MDIPPPPRPDLKVVTAPIFPQALFDELSAAVRGEVFRPADPEYTERAKTFNGQLQPTCRVLVSPVDAQDVSAVVKFCLKHELSPSVRAGGYGIAGWAVAGDVIVDMSMIKDIEIERPLPVDEGEVDWVPLSEMPAPGSKGKGRSGGVLLLTGSGAPSDVSTAADGSGSWISAAKKRRREERSSSPASPSPAARPEEVGSDAVAGAGQRLFENASTAVATFLRGPPLPPVPGETPRQPPTNRQRVHSPAHGGELESHSREQDRVAAAAAAAGGAGTVPPSDERMRQISGGSSRSSDGSSQMTAFSPSTNATTPLDDCPIDPPPSASPSTTSHPPDAREPFSHLAPGGAPPPSYHHPPLLLPLGAGVSAIPAFFPPAPVLGSSAGVTAWNPFTLGPSRSGMAGPAGALPFSTVPPTLPGPGQSFSFPPGAGILGGGGGGGGLSVSDAFAQALQAAQAASGHLGTMPHAKPVHPHAYVTFGAGMRQKDIDTFTSDNPLEGVNAVTGEKDAAVPYHIPMSAHPVGSSIMLLSGFGFISRMHGLSIDNLVEVEMVLADGRIIVVNAEQDPELWWAIRGAGPAFGIVTRYKARAYPVPVVFAGNIIYRFHRATAASLIKHFRDCIKGAPRELYANVLLTAGPADKDSLVVIQMCYAGPKEKGIEFLHAISSWDGERCLLNEVNEKSYLNQQDSVAQVIRGRAGRQWFLRSSLITSLPDELITRTVMEFADTPIGCTWIFELAGGAIGDFEDNCLPKEQREAAWTVAAFHQWDIGIDDPRCVTTAEDWMKDTIKPHSIGGPLPTFLGRHEPPARVKACYGKNWERLAALKRKYDPTGFFKNNLWPVDRDGRDIDLLHNEPPSPVD